MQESILHFASALLPLAGWAFSRSLELHRRTEIAQYLPDDHPETQNVGVWNELGDICRLLSILALVIGTAIPILLIFAPFFTAN